MKPLAEFANDCTQWSDEFLLEQVAQGPAAYVALEYFDAIRAELSRRSLSAQPSPPPQAAPARGTYLGRLWRGDVPLATTYWGWGVGGNVLLYVAMRLVVRWGGLAALRVMVMLSLIYSIFVWVAIWRSAGRYKTPWGALARMSVVLGVLRTIVAYGMGE